MEALSPNLLLLKVLPNKMDYLLHNSGKDSLSVKTINQDFIIKDNIYHFACNKIFSLIFFYSYMHQFIKEKTGDLCQISF